MIDFPNPTGVGHVFNANGYAYRWDGTVWGQGTSTATIPDAPKDGKNYARKDGAWVDADLTFATDAALATTNANVAANTSAIAAKIGDAPDATTYGRKSGAWVNLANHERVNVDAAGSVTAPGNIAASGGIVTANSAAANATLNLIKNGAANASDIYGALGGNIHWLLRLGQGGGTDDYALVRYNDAGVYQEAVMSARRSDGLVNFPSAAGITMAGTLNITKASGDALYANQPIVSTSSSGNAFYSASGGINLGGWASFGQQLYAASGMGMRWDGANANFLGMGGGVTGGWCWQWNRSTGQLNWLNNLASALLAIDPSGNVAVTGQLSCNARMTVYGADASAFYAPSGGVNVGGAIGCGQGIIAQGRIQSNVTGDFAAFYAPNTSGFYAPAGRFRSDASDAAAVYTPNGGITVHPSIGLTATTATGNSPYICVLAQGNPNWSNGIFQTIHFAGQWAGGRFWAANMPFDFNCSTGHFVANGVDLGSDERTKENLQPIPEAASLFAGTQAYEYDRIGVKTMDGSPQREVGLVAQHLKKLPRVMLQYKATEADAEPTRRIDLGAMNALQSQAIGELLARIQRLEAQIEELNKEPA